ncbi:MAG: GAF and ANTAR domain-containing protein [Herbiconiux sp.]|nr:GAF and ANTAR domain-containing protein [Herbiconiux sp.]
MARDEYGAAADVLESPEHPLEASAAVFARAFDVSGAAVSTVGDFLGNETISASDDRAARLDELQFDLGEGPCWEALSTLLPVHEPDLRHSARHTWPAFTRAALQEPIGAVFAFPMTVGALRLGAVDLYSVEPRTLSDEQSREAIRLAGIVGRRILRRALDSAAVAATADQTDAEPESRFSRRTIHQATGMVLAQLDISAEEAGLVIQGHAFATERSMMSVAADILAGRLDFSKGENGIEDPR